MRDKVFYPNFIGNWDSSKVLQINCKNKILFGAPGIKLTSTLSPIPSSYSYHMASLKWGFSTWWSAIKMFCKESDLHLHNENDYKLVNIFKESDRERWDQVFRDVTYHLITQLRKWRSKETLDSGKGGLLPPLWWNQGLCLFRKAFSCLLCSIKPAGWPLSFQQNTSTWGSTSGDNKPVAMLPLVPLSLQLQEEGPVVFIVCHF